MNRLTFYMILLQGLFLGIATASAKSPSVNKVDTELSANHKVVERVVTARSGEKSNSKLTTETSSGKISALSQVNDRNFFRQNLSIIAKKY